MRENLIAVGLLMVVIMLWTYVATAEASESNNAMKRCLIQNDYTPDKFDTFDFSKAAACHSEYRIFKTQVEYQAMREFLKHKPWYRGTKWNWEDRVELTCHTEFHTGVTYCHRPAYIE